MSRPRANGQIFIPQLSTNKPGKPALRSQGFTLAEVLVAIIVLLIGVVAVMRIFPRGFEIFSRSQQSYTGMAQVDSMVAELTQHPENLPEGIYPVDWDDSKPEIQISNNFWDDITATTFVDKNPSDPDNPYRRRLFNGIWPLWEPLCTRVLRRVVGERCVIPSDVSRQLLCTATSATNNGNDKWTLGVDKTSGLSDGMAVFIKNSATSFTTATVESIAGNTVNVTVAKDGTIENGAEIYAVQAFAPRYIVRFGPIEDISNINIYDLRYRRVNASELKEIAVKETADNLYYGIDYDAASISFPVSAENKDVRFIFACRKDDGTIRQIRPVCWTLKTTTGSQTIPMAPADTITLDGIDVTATGAESSDKKVYTLSIQLPTGWHLISGSEQLNRAYQLRIEPDPSNPTVMYNLPSGTFCVLPENKNDLQLGSIFFSPADAGRSVKIDYTVADWNILHENQTVTKDGVVTLSLTPKVRKRPSGPHETQAWGLYGPIVDGSIVMGLVDVSNGFSYDITVDNPQVKNPNFHVIPTNNAAGIVDPVIAIDQDDSRHRDFSLGTLNTNYSWNGYWSSGQAYAQKDVVFYNGEYYQCDVANTASNTNAPGNGSDWSVLSSDAVDWTGLKGKTFRIFYRAQGDWTLQLFRPPAVFWFTAAPKPASGVTDTDRRAGLANNMDLAWNSFSWVPSFSGTRAWLALPGSYAGQTVEVDYLYSRSGAANQLQQVSGEPHTIPAGEGSKNNSIIKLNHAPADNTLV
ncbi:MAG TPA: prepilin-type N-terminal cleavage/methylation domain-containing protein, partial [Armatimonadota bacterium]|nr:prepilin-type N-terminal cleavage/methylation domain-containing protein [Armatimonadota bacterium]